MNRGVLVLSVCFVASAAAQLEMDPAQEAPAAPEVDANEGFFTEGMKWAIGGTGLTLAGLGLFLAIGGLKHVDEQNVLEHPLRNGIMETVSSAPGVHLRELATQHGTAVTNTQWHLRKLEQAGLVRTQKVGGRRLYYPTKGGVATKKEAEFNAATLNPNAEKIFAFVSKHIGCDLKKMAEALQLNPGTVRWHVRRLETAGLLKTESHGSQVYYFPAQTKQLFA
jgi:predicted transcriptional regulator